MAVVVLLAGSLLPVTLVLIVIAALGECLSETVHIGLPAAGSAFALVQAVGAGSLVTVPSAFEAPSFVFGG